MPKQNNFKKRLTSLLSRISPEKFVGASGLAVLCAGSILAFSPASGPTLTLALTQYLASLGLNVLAGVLHKAYQELLSEPSTNEINELVEIAQRVTKELNNQPQLRNEIGKFLDNTDAFQIAEEVARGNPAVHGWLLLQIYQEVNKYAGELLEIKRALEEIEESTRILLSHFLIDDRQFYNVPQIPPQGIYGREKDLMALRKLLIPEQADGRVAPISLLGMGGIGKSTLAIAFGNLPGIGQFFPHGILWTELGPKAAISKRLIELGAEIGLDVSPLSSNEARSQRLRDALYNKRILIIVDDVWDSSQGSFFNIGGPNSRTLYTTRELPIANDLATPRRIYRVGGLSPVASLRLLRNLAPDVVRADEDAAKTLCRKLDYLPLAIKLAGRFLANEALTHQSRTRLTQNLISNANERLALSQFEKRLGIEEAKPTLRAILGLSIDQLHRVDQERFAMLSVFGGDPLTWDFSAASHIWECNDADAEQTITHLVQRGLIEQSHDRYRMHVLFADYAQILRDEWSL